MIKALRLTSIFWLASALLVSAVHAKPSGQTLDKIDFTAFAQAFVEAHCGKGSSVEDCDLERVLGDFARVRLGAFELCYPAAFFKQKQCSEDFGQLAVALLDYQRLWIEWLTFGTENGTAGLEDLALVREWVDGWFVKRLSKLAKKPPTLDLCEFFEMPDEVRAAEQRLFQFLHDSEKLGLPLPDGRAVRIALSPTRLDFIQWVSYAGLLAPDEQEKIWVEGVDEWTQFWCAWTLVAALEYAPWTGFDPEFRTGKSMKSFDPTGLVEQVSLQAGMALLRICLDRDLGHAENAIAMNLVIELVGQLNTIDGVGQIKNTGGQTQPYSRFVPGGSSQGGTLPPKSAQSRNAVEKNQWREGSGSDHFVKPLRKGQKAGYKAAAKEKKERWRDKQAHFLLKSDTGKHVVSAPFLGPKASEQAYPPFEYLNDYTQFFRAYKSAFFHWLRTRADPESEQASLAKFREFLDGLGASTDEGDPIDALCRRIYGVPVSATSGETDSLEWRFLKFLDDGK
jgi:hypothetical protein